VSRSDDNTDVLRRAASGADQGNARPMTMGIAKVGRVTANALVYRARMGAEGKKSGGQTAALQTNGTLRVSDSSCGRR
jgi:hypothetical protein